jgi:DNA-binding CsgD family transcriptional regulator
VTIDAQAAASARVAALLGDGAPQPAESVATDLLAAHRAIAGQLQDSLEDREGFAYAAELHRLACRLVEEGIAPRLDSVERVHAALARLGEHGPVSEILAFAPREAAVAVGLDRVLLSRIQDGALIAEGLHVREDPEGARATLARLREAPVPLEYPLIEGELLRRRRPLLVAAGGGEPGRRRAHADVMGWRDYVTAPIVLEGRVIGFLHGDRTGPDTTLRPLDRDALAGFAQGFAHIVERAILRRRLRIQRQEMRQVATWADARTSELSDRAVDLAADRDADDDPGPGSSAAVDSSLRDLLTRRELDVLELMVKGDTNAGIARELVVSEGTVKFHVKNILRKLHAANRAEATSRYLRLTLRRGEVPGSSTGGR